MEQTPKGITSQMIKVDIEYFISMALQSKISWDTLVVFLDDLTPTLDQSKQAIKIIVKELQSLNSKLQDKIKDDVESKIEILNRNTSNESSKTQIPIESSNSDKLSNQDEHIQGRIEAVSHTQKNECVDELSFQINGENCSVELQEYSKPIEDFQLESNRDESKPSDELKEINTQEEAKSEILASNSLNVDIALKRSRKFDRNFVCEICNKTFSLSRDFKRHQRIHTGEKPYKCMTCEKSFNQLGILHSHKSIHADEKKFQCQTCNKSFKILQYLKQHEKVHSFKKQLEKPKKNKSPKIYPCEICNISFKTSGGWNRHERVHTGARPYKCKDCSKCFKDSGTLRRHEQSVHSGEKPFQCKACDKCFNTSGHLKQHERVHLNAITAKENSEKLQV